MTKLELMKAMMDGKRYTNGSTVAYFDEKAECPFLLEYSYGKIEPIRGIWDSLKRMPDSGWREVAQWYDDIPEHGILCWYEGRLVHIVRKNDFDDEYVCSEVDCYCVKDLTPLTYEEIVRFAE